MPRVWLMFLLCWIPQSVTTSKVLIPDSRPNPSLTQWDVGVVILVPVLWMQTCRNRTACGKAALNICSVWLEFIAPRDSGVCFPRAVLTLKGEFKLRNIRLGHRDGFIRRQIKKRLRRDEFLLNLILKLSALWNVWHVFLFVLFLLLFIWFYSLFFFFACLVLFSFVKRLVTLIRKVQYK